MTAGERRRAGDPHACLLAITRGHDLDAEESEALFATIMDGRASPVVIGALLAALRTKGETVAEIAGAARVMRARAERLGTTREPLVDTCGTGGDFSGTFNVSTAAAFVAAGAGLAVAKHGNRAASSRSGSADVLEALGVEIDLDPGRAARCIDSIGIAFLFAPRFHPAMRHAMGARREIGIRTIFNLLGPLTNPAGARRQVIGVPTPDTLDRMAAALRTLGCDHALVVHGQEGLDEISVSGATLVAEVRGGHVETTTVEPSDLGLAPHPSSAIAGGDAVTNAGILRDVLAGRGTAGQAAFAAANAGAALYVGGAADSLREGVDRAREILASGRALAVLESLIEVSRSLARDPG